LRAEINVRLHTEKIFQVWVVALPELFVGAAEDYPTILQHNELSIYQAQFAVLTLNYNLTAFVNCGEVRRQLFDVFDAVSHEDRADAFKIAKFDR
jgi:hypothetical protein